MKLEIDTEDHDIEGLIWEINDFSDTFIEQNTKKIHSKDLGMDERVGNIYVGDSFIAVPLNGHSQKMLEYYGGFEYVDEEDIRYLGNYKIYLNSCNRVASHLERLKN